MCLGGVTDLPVNADFEAGFAATPDGVAANVTRCIATGVAGLSIEDLDGTALHAVEPAAERVRAARAAIDASGEDMILVGRCEAYLMERLDLDAVIARLKAMRPLAQIASTRRASRGSTTSPGSSKPSASRSTPT